MIIARKDPDRIDNAWYIISVDEDGVETQIFAFNAPAAWMEVEVLANWERIKLEADM